MLRKLALRPMGAVAMPVSLPPWTDTPWRLHVMERGKSPELTTHETWA